MSAKEGKDLATSLGVNVSYADCSSLTDDGVQEATNKAMELAIDNFINQKKHSSSKLKGFFKRKSKNSTSVKDEEQLPPAGTENKNILLNIYCACLYTSLSFRLLSNKLKLT